MKTLLVIGGSGFFGKSILDAFQRGLLEPWEIGHVFVVARNAARLGTDYPELVGDRVSLHDVDISICEQLPSADYVIHAAASTDASRYLSRPLEERRNIQAGTYNYCRIASQIHRESRIVYISSGAVYGQQPPAMELMDESFQGGTIESLPENKRDYAAAKRDAEESIRRLGQRGLRVSIARCFAFVGRWLPRDQHFAIGNFLADGLAGRDIVVKATNQVYRSYMYADDLVRWLMTICEGANSSCPTYNVGSERGVLVKELAEQLSAYFGVKASNPSASHLFIDRYVPCTAKARQELELELKYDLDQAIAATVKAIIRHQ